MKKRLQPDDSLRKSKNNKKKSIVATDQQQNIDFDKAKADAIEKGDDL